MARLLSILLLTNLLICLNVHAESKNNLLLTENQNNEAEKIIDGKVHVKRVELKGRSLYPEYGVTQAYISKKVKEAYQKLDPWMSIGDMHFIADSLTVAYHEKGLTFNQVFVVPNEIQNGTLILNVLSGTVSEINLKNNKLYSEEQIKKPFLPLLGKVVYEPDIKRAMKQANAIPGLKVFGFFSMGNLPGQTRLNLHVLKEETHNFSVRVDNYGVNNTGVYRVIGQYQQNNVSGKGDVLQANIISTDEIGNLYGGINYLLPAINDHKFSIALYSNQFEVVDEFEVFGLNGHLTALSGFYQSTLVKTRNAVASHSHQIAFKHSEIRSDSGDDLINNLLSENTDYTLYQPHANASIALPSGDQFQNLSASFKLGHITKTDNEELDDMISVLELGYSHEWVWHQEKNLAARVNASAHYSFGILPSSERRVMTGPYSVRGYSPALFSADTVYSLNIEQTLPAFAVPLEIGAVPFLFIDSANGEQNSDDGENETFIAAGLGINLNYGKKIQGNLTLGAPVNADTDKYPDSDNPAVYGYITVEF